MTRRYSSAVVSATGANTVAIALLIQTSMGPHRSSTAAAASSTASASDTSSGSTSASPPARRTSSAATSSASSFRAMRPSLAPRAANARTTARPTPDDAPVTTTTLGLLGPVTLDLHGSYWRSRLLASRNRRREAEDRSVWQQRLRGEPVDQL